MRRKRRERRQTLPQLIFPETARAMRHAIHTYHHIEHFAEHEVRRRERVAHLIARAITGGPLSVTIAASIALEDMPEVPPEELASLEAEIYAILATTGIEIVAEAQSQAPVRTGMLRNSISYITDNEALAVTVSADTSYAKYVEYGTSKMEAEPFLVDAAMSHQQDLDEQINNAIQSHLNGRVDGDVDSDTVDLEIETETVSVTSASEASEALAGFAGFAELVGL